MSASEQDKGLDAQQLQDRYGGHWGEHPEHNEREWKLEVENENTRLGYWDWVRSMIENEG